MIKVIYIAIQTRKSGFKGQSHYLIATWFFSKTRNLSEPPATHQKNGIVPVLLSYFISYETSYNFNAFIFLFCNIY